MLKRDATHKIIFSWPNIYLIYIYIYICKISATIIVFVIITTLQHYFSFVPLLSLITISYVWDCVGRYVVVYIDKAVNMLISLFVFCLFNNSIRVRSFWSLHEEWFNLISHFGDFSGFITFSVLSKEMSEVYEPIFISRMFSKVLNGRFNVG